MAFFMWEGGWTQALKLETSPGNDSKQKEQVPVSMDWHIGNSRHVSACFNKN